MLAQHVFYDTAEDYVRTIRGSGKLFVLSGQVESYRL
jgi:hypothetical protein